MTVFNPTGSLNVALDPSDIKDGDFVRCKNLRIDQRGQVKTRDGSTKLNSSAIDTTVWHIEVQNGVRYVFAGNEIFEDESSIESGLTSAQWSGIQYSAFNDPSKNVFALNGTDRKRIEGGTVYEWGIDAPTGAPILQTGDGTGLTGKYNARYTYVRKVGDLIVSESDPSPAALNPIVLNDQSLAALISQSPDSQVTHLRLYRTLASPVADLWYLDQEIEASKPRAYGYAFNWEVTDPFATYDPFIPGHGFKFTVTDARHSTENTYTWEETFEDREDEDTRGSREDVQNFRDFLDQSRRREDYQLP